jgi:integrase
MATFALDVGDRVARQALVEKPSYTANDDDLDASFFLNGALSAASAAPAITFLSQYRNWIEGLRNREWAPVAPSTLATFESRAKTILSIVGPQTKLEDFRNAAMANFVRDAKRFEWAPSTLADHILVIKLIISSATDPEGEELFPRTWKRRVINAPRVERDKQHTPCLTSEAVETLLRKAKMEQERLIYAFLCGSGLRVSEAQAARINGNEKQTSWNPRTAVVSVRNGCFRGAETGRTKTAAGRRNVVLCGELNQALIAFTSKERRESGSFLFQSKNGLPLKQSTLRYRMAQHVPDAAPHAARRFRISWLRNCRVLEEIIRGQVGHADESITDTYSFQDERVRAAVEAAGLGFNLNVAAATRPSPRAGEDDEVQT